MSREDRAEKLGVSTQFVADIEYGNKGVSIRKLYLLCQILDVTADYVLAGNVYSRDEDEEAVKSALKEIMQEILNVEEPKLNLETKPSVILFVGVNGARKNYINW